jgi:hypothetical protein
MGSATNRSSIMGGSNPLTANQGYYRLLQLKGEILLITVKA